MLKPQNLIQAAEADLARRIRNIERHQGIRMSPNEQYAFYAPHVTRAESVEHLLRLAFKKPTKALLSKKKNTKLIYGNPDLLQAALQITAAQSAQSPP